MHFRECAFSFSISLLSFLLSSAWLTGYEDPLIDRINQRIEDLTGLEIDTAEELQVRNYYMIAVMNHLKAKLNLPAS